MRQSARASATRAAAAVCMAALCWACRAGAWTATTFDDFSRRRLADGGANTFVSRDGSVRLINPWDCNGDGCFDLPVVCPQDYTETPDLCICWSGRDGYSAQHPTRLPAEGCVAGAAADLDGDGWPDLVVCNRFDGEKNNLDSYIHWGAADGFSARRITRLPTEAAMGAAVGDLNGDGYADIVFANAGADYHMTVDSRQKSFVYWGSRKGFSARRRLELKTVQATDVAIADVTADGHPDVIFACEGNAEKESGALIYANDGKGRFLEKRCVHLPGIGSSGVAAVDLDRDGFPHVVLSNRARITAKPDPPTYDLVETCDVNSFVYWGSRNGYSAARRTELPTSAASAPAVGDPNGDGLPALGPHYFSGLDVGNLYDRSGRYPYVSPPFDAGPNPSFVGLTWDADTPFRTRVEFQVRTAATEAGLQEAGWRGPGGRASCPDEAARRGQPGHSGCADACVAEALGPAWPPANL